MSLVWDPKLATGHTTIDQQHQELFRVLGELLDGMQAGRAKSEVAKTLTFLKGYVVQHFGMEEQLMRSTGFPGAASHVAAHQAFVKDFLALEADFERAGPTASLAIQLNKRVCEWLRQHIARVDQELARFVALPARAAAAAPIRTSR